MSRPIFFGSKEYGPRIKQVKKFKEIQERAIRFVKNDYESDYLTLLKSNVSVTMEVKRMRFLCIEIYKTLNDLNPEYTKSTFQCHESKAFVQKISKCTCTNSKTDSLWFDSLRFKKYTL